MTTYIYGASDDLVEFEGDFREEFYLRDLEKSYFRITDTDNPEVGIYVQAEFSPFGWTFGVALLEEENTPLPWEIWFDSEFKGSSYSPTLAIETPENITVTEVDRRGEALSDD